MLAVVNELSKLDTDLQVTFVCDKAFEEQSRGLMSHAAVPVVVKTISAGKLRRYHGIAWYRQLFDLPTTSKNIADISRIMNGFRQSLWLMLRERPDVVFAKGGFVCLPLGLAAKMLRIPLVIHDSDARPGLTNSVLARYADKITTGSPLDNYPSYPKTRSHYTGVPISADFSPLTEEEKRQAREEIGVVDLSKPLVVVTGGGLGAKTINNAVVQNIQHLLEKGIGVYHVTGKRDYNDIVTRAKNHADYQIVPFVYKDMAKVLGAADIVVSRGSATFTQEIAALGKPMIMIPSHVLGDQVKNAEVYEKARAAVVLSDHDITRSTALTDTIIELVEHPEESNAMAERLHAFARPHAAQDVAKAIFNVWSTNGGVRR